MTRDRFIKKWIGARNFDTPEAESDLNECIMDFARFVTKKYTEQELKSIEQLFTEWLKEEK